MKNTIIADESSSSLIEEKEDGVVKIIVKLAGIIFLPTIAIMVLSHVVYGLIFYPDTLGDYFSSIQGQLFVSYLSPLLTIALLITITKKPDWQSRFHFWAIKQINRKIFIKWLLFSCIFIVLLEMPKFLLDMPNELFMLELQASANTLTMQMLILIAFSLIAPIMEELIFRGWLYSTLANTKLNKISVILLSAIIFSSIHLQYENLITFINIFFIGLFFAVMRYKTENIAYSMIFHFLFNFTVIINLFYF